MAKNNFELEQVAIRLVPEKSLVSENKLNTPEKIVKELAKQIFTQLDREEIGIVNFTKDLKPINFSVVAIGDIANCLANPREMLKASILSNAANVIMLHNHPSGSLNPSKEDETITKRVLQCFNMMGINVLDHVIVAAHDTQRFYSFRDAGEIEFGNYKLNYEEKIQFEDISSQLIKNISSFYYADDLAYWTNNNCYFHMTANEAELLLDYEESIGRMMCLDEEGDLIVHDVAGTYSEKCNIDKEIYNMCDNLQEQFQQAKEMVSNSSDFVDYCNNQSTLMSIKEKDEIAKELFAKTELGKKYNLGNLDKDMLVAEPQKKMHQLLTK